MDASKKIKVTIFGDSYTLVSDEDEAQLMQISTELDLLMKDIAQRTKITDTKKIAVLAALQWATKAHQANNHVSALSQKANFLAEAIDQHLANVSI